MSNLAIERIILQTRLAESKAASFNEGLVNAPGATPLTPEELKLVLESILCPNQENVAKEDPEQEIQEIRFENIYDFTPWYTQNKLKFSAGQRVALDTIEQARAAIEAGCACKRHSREIRAHQYFEQFWLNNKETDILPTISKVAGGKKVFINAYCSHTP